MGLPNYWWRLTIKVLESNYKLQIPSLVALWRHSDVKSWSNDVRGTTHKVVIEEYSRGKRIKAKHRKVSTWLNASFRENKNFLLLN